MGLLDRQAAELTGGKPQDGGEEGIRTLEKLLTSTPLAGERLRPLGHLSVPRFLRVSRHLARINLAEQYGSKPNGAGTCWGKWGKWGIGVRQTFSCPQISCAGDNRITGGRFGFGLAQRTGLRSLGRTLCWRGRMTRRSDAKRRPPARRHAVWACHPTIKPGPELANDADRP